GPVKSANGLIDANTVTFTPQWDQRLEVEAVASATGPGGGEPAASSGGPGGLPAWAALALAGGVLLAAAAAGRVAAIRRKRAAGAAGDPDPLSPAGGFGPLPAAHGSASPTRPAQDPRP
ncbi:MAG: hypothetical protein LBD70_06350, partial [Bifidobacteriaceae bacterium]|nr:hypothetical protein [Bifidobacteriaceae bacterium]